jgi:hypothetical protein
MDRMKRIMVLTVSILAVALLASASSWEGSAMMGSYGDFPSGGYFAACNSFPRNTAVEVTNLETGKSVTVIIVRGLDNPGIFMMVSAEAAEALGLRQGRITRVKAVEPRSVSSLAPSAGARTALDADFNPRLLAAEELKRMGYDLVETPSTPAAVPGTPVPDAPASVSGTVPVAAAPEAPVPEPVAESIATTPAVAVPVPIPPLDEGPQLVQDLVRPDPVTAAPELVPVPGPETPRPTVADKPDAINGGKPKPVRTLVLPELPEPEVHSAMAVIEPTDDGIAAGSEQAVPGEQPLPEIFARTLPVPDETPIRVIPSPVPRRFEAPAALPDVLDRPRTARLAPEMVQLSLIEPDTPGSGEGLAVPLEMPPARLAAEGTVPLAEPSAAHPDRAVAHELTMPARQRDSAIAALAWPELEADEIPDVVLARLVEPAQTIPATSLAEGEIIFPETGAPAAVALETPSFAAAETRVALAQPEAEPLDQPDPHDSAAPPALSAEPEVELAEAGIVSEDPRVAEREAPVPVQAAPDGAIEAPDPEEALPGEVIVVMEPTDLRPPVVDAPLVVEAPPAVEAPERKALDPVVRTPEPAKTVPVASVQRPAMVSGALEKGRHYIQVGAYRTEAAAAETVSVLRMDYVIVLETPAGSSSKIWKIFVGPLGRDESGIALLRVRSLGFKDAFLKVGG